MEQPINPQQPVNDQPEPKTANTALKVIVLLILIGLLILGIILPIKLVPNALNTVSTKINSWFKKDTSTTLSTDKNPIMSGESFNVSWNKQPSKTGIYAFKYSCTPGVEAQTSLLSPNETIACDSNYYFSSSTARSINLTLISTSSKSAEVLVTLSYLENTATSTNELGTVLLAVSNPQARSTTVATPKPSQTVKPSTSPKPTTTVSPKPTPTNSPATPGSGTITRTNRVSNPNGRPDLSVRILAVGYMNDNAEFIPAVSVNATQRPAFKFVVTNLGDKNSGAWNFRTLLPTPYHPSYTAYNLPNLGPGDSIAYVLGFDGINNSYVNSIRIDIDPSNLIGDLNTSNNWAKTTINNVSASY